MPAAGERLLERMVGAPEAEVREAAAWALGNQNPKTVRPLVDALHWEIDSFVRLNLLAALAIFTAAFLGVLSYIRSLIGH